MTDKLLGEISAIGAAISWSACALIYTVASHRIGSFSMNHYRVIFGLIIIAIIHFVLTGTLLPVNISSMNWSLLVISGVIGYFLADASLYQSYTDIGPRLGVLMFNFYPIMSSFLAWMFLREVLSIYACIGILATISGIVWVVLEKRPVSADKHKKNFARGICFAAGAGVFQAITFTIVKPAMTGDNPVDPLTATLVRYAAGCAAYWGVSILRGRFIQVLKKVRDMKSMAFIGTGSLIDSAFGIWLAMIAVKLAPVGIASTLMALMPIMIIPMVAIAYKERVSPRAIIGTLIACLGVAILFNV